MLDNRLNAAVGVAVGVAVRSAAGPVEVEAVQHGSAMDYQIVAHKPQLSVPVQEQVRRQRTPDNTADADDDAAGIGAHGTFVVAWMQMLE